MTDVMKSKERDSFYLLTKKNTMKVEKN